MVSVYNILLKYINTNNNKLKYYKDKYKIIPVDIIKQNLYFELARPIQSGFRWEKIYNRLDLVNKFYPTDKNNKILRNLSNNLNSGDSQIDDLVNNYSSEYISKIVPSFS